jgi:hypothetical protein
MPIYLKQSTASQEVPLGHFVDDADGKTAETGLTIANTDIKVWKCGATTLANKNSGGATHIAGGVYYCVLDATDTDTLGSLVLFVAVSGALAVRVECVVLAANIYDSLIGGGDILDVSMTQILGTAVSTPATAGVLDVNLKNIANAAVSTSSAQLGVNVVQAGATAWGSGAITAASIASNAITSAKIATDAIGSAQIADGAIDAGAIASNAITSAKIAAGAITAAAIADGAIDAATFAADVDAEILSYLVDDATRIDASALNTLSSHDPGEAIMGTTDLGTGAGLTSLATAAALTTVDGVADAIKAVTDLLPDAGALTSLATASALATVDGVADAIKAQTDQLTFGVTGKVDANITHVNETAVGGDGGSGTEWGPA